MDCFVRRTLVACALAVVPAAAVDAQLVDLSGDVRVRLEQDWDSRTATGTMRDDRARARVRARIAAKVDFGDGFAFDGRVRSAGNDSQQNANVTFADFDSNPTDTLYVIPDRFALAWKSQGATISAGRMAFPFFTQNEYFWDGDISPLGAAVQLSTASGGTSFGMNAGGFLLPAGANDYSGTLVAAQAVGKSRGVSVAAGLFDFKADRSDPDRLLLLDDNGSRNYTVLALNAKYIIPVGGKPLSIGADLYRNLRSYRHSADAISRAYGDQRTGYVLSTSWGDTAKPGHLEIGYRYSHIEKLAVDASYAHDDVARFGTASQSSLTDLKGHDLYAGYALSKPLTVGVRAMFVRRISNGENGKRARIDLIYSF